MWQARDGKQSQWWRSGPEYHKGVKVDKVVMPSWPQGDQAQWTIPSKIAELSRITAVKPADFDPKAVQLLGALDAAGELEAACSYLSKYLDGLERDMVSNWPAYLFTMLRRFDPPVYEQMKEARGRPRPRRSDLKGSHLVVQTQLRAAAPEFVPGQPWEGFPADPPSATGVAVTFRVRCPDVKEGEVVAVAGSHPVLGLWEGDGAKILTESKRGSDIYVSEDICLPADAMDLEFKFLVLGSDKTSVRWEDIKANRKLVEGQPPATAHFGLDGDFPDSEG